ncbi:MAG: hypothetical protein E7Z78_08910 [Methanobrevibacter thaueri]|jgi:hypothetical protein|uniref:hypothetical protein n=1 Tax=Methanobrevibacter thaueri TaxID=190975 RepID=UPI0026E966AF|nr:hypothetical protein [Methanobrevibacter thaueri]MBE6496547.1 hypothetical protein [Methanobrevibacter thaueri]
MKTFKIAIIALLLLVLSVAFVSATEISDFNAPKGFDEGFGESMDNEDDFSIVLNDYDKDFDEDLFKGDHFHQVTVKGDLAEFNDTFNDEAGVMELIKIGKTYYVVKCKYAENTDPSKISDCTKYLEEFNKKNDLKPEKIKV